MSSIWGNNIKLAIFGESHGKAIGINMDGLPSGIELDFEHINSEMQRRAPGKNKLSTSRKEKDQFEILSGYFENKTTGTPLCCIIMNNDQRSKDYSKIKNLMRPGHADYTGKLRYRGYNDYRGGGHFSGRLTAPLVFAGAIAKQILSKKNIIIASHIKSIANIEDDSFNTNIQGELLERLLESDFPVLDESKTSLMKDVILKAKEQKNSVGGVIEAVAVNLPAGIGSPFFNSLESMLAHLLFSIPAVKGVEFGAGFKLTQMTGAQANDELYYENDKVKTYSNNNGGINGGITNGMPLIYSVAIKPTPSIGVTQRTIDIAKEEEAMLEVDGRHDPCIVQRVIPVVEAVTALAVLDLLMDRRVISW